MARYLSCIIVASGQITGPWKKCVHGHTEYQYRGPAQEVHPINAGRIRAFKACVALIAPAYAITAAT